MTQEPEAGSWQAVQEPALPRSFRNASRAESFLSAAEELSRACSLAKLKPNAMGGIGSKGLFFSYG